MGFSSVTFLFFFLPIFMALYFAAPGIQAKNIVTLVCSLIFYGWDEPQSLPILLGAIAINTYAGLAIDARRGPSRRVALGITVAVNLFVLATFKYAAFLAGIVGAILLPFGIRLATPKIALPLGISFFTFHCISYVIDVYRGRFPANRKPSEVALYIALFPQLIAGPIVRYKTVARQLRQRRHSLRLIETGTRMFIIGLAQKVMVADSVAPLARAAFDLSPHPTLIDAWIGLVSYTLQIYFDFAGYSNMAVGLGLIMGFSLPRNFRMPYTALSIREFWQRWHMSLSSWLRDYLYIPLGGSRGSPWQTYRNLVTVFLLCGLWHGASWNFVLWGALHGIFLILERQVTALRGMTVPKTVRWLYAMLVVMGGWVLFRAEDLPAAATFYAGLIGLNGTSGMSVDVHLALQPLTVLPLLAGAVLAVAPRWRLGDRRLISGWPARCASEAWVFGVLLLSLWQVAAGTYSPFLYFRF